MMNFRQLSEAAVCCWSSIIQRPLGPSAMPRLRDSIRLTTSLKRICQTCRSHGLESSLQCQFQMDVRMSSNFRWSGP